MPPMGRSQEGGHSRSCCRRGHQQAAPRTRGRRAAAAAGEAASGARGKLSGHQPMTSACVAQAAPPDPYRCKFVHAVWYLSPVQQQHMTLQPVDVGACACLTRQHPACRQKPSGRRRTACGRPWTLCRRSWRPRPLPGLQTSAPSSAPKVRLKVLEGLPVCCHLSATSHGALHHLHVQ